MQDSKEMNEITKALNQIAIDATPNRRRSKRVRHLKAKQMVQSNKENEKEEEKEESKEKLNPISETKQLQTIFNMDLDFNKNDIIFPLFKTIKYKLIIDKYDISLPLHLHKWLTQLLAMINNCDIETEIDAYSWIVLLYPSLVLVKNSRKYINSPLHKLVTETIKKLSDFMHSEALQTSELSLNDSLICIELFETEKKRNFYLNINKLMEATNTFNKFLKISCSRSKDIKFVQELLNCSSAQIIGKKTLYNKIRSKWESFIGVYTQMVRLHRLYKLDTNKNSNNLSKLCKENIIKICDIFDKNYCNILRDLLVPLKQKTDCIKMDYSYHRYKTMAMCTHSPTAIVPAFAAYYGYVDNHKKNNIDMTLWKVMIDALLDDVNQFTKTANEILLILKDKKIKKSYQNIINKMPKKSTHFLRILDHICYQSVCAMLMYQSYDGKDKNIKLYFNKLIKIRKDICVILHKLADNSLLFCDTITALNKDILHSCFLTYDKEQKQVWSVHLMSGILLNYWIRK